MVGRRYFVVSLVAAAALLATGCGGDGGLVDIKEPGPPVGEALMPDISPAPPQDAHISHEDGRWLIRFSTSLANIGEGDFVLRATKGVRDWEVDQDVQYSESGAKVYETPARLVWGGDGHDHWHVQRIAVGRLTPFRENAAPPTEREGWADTKIGFCYYDFTRLEEDAPQEVVYPRHGCGNENDTAIGMGLSWGWMDIYPFGLQGQAIDVTSVPDGKYRLWVEVDEKKWFQEARRDNNVSWADLELVTRKNGARAVQDVVSGPPIQLGP
jgi:hypothetical protein